MKAKLSLAGMDEMYFEHLSCDIDIPFVPNIGTELFISEKVYDQLRIKIIENQEYGEYLFYMPEPFVKDWTRDDTPRDPTEEELECFIFSRHLYILGVAYNMESETIQISASTFNTYESLCEAFDRCYYSD